MSNHFHLLLKEGREPLGASMKRLGVSYAMRYNLKTGHVGHVFQNRFASEPVDSDEYFLAVVRYIHSNPAKAGVCAPGDYPLSSYREYAGQSGICDTSVLLDMIDGAGRFAEFNAVEDEAECIDVEERRRRLSDEKALRRAKKLFGPNLQKAFAAPDRALRNGRLRQLRDAGVSIRQAERITGIGRKPISVAFADKAEREMRG